MEIKGKSTETILYDIELHISRCPGKFYSEFYIGTSDDPRRQLFDIHQVDEKTDCWTYHRAIDIKNAKETKEQLKEKGMKTAPDGKENGGLYVYCYHMTAHTIE